MYVVWFKVIYWQQLDLLVHLAGDLMGAHGTDQHSSSGLKHIRTHPGQSPNAQRVIPQSAQ